MAPHAHSVSRRRFLLRALPVAPLLVVAPASADLLERGREILGTLTDSDNGSALSSSDRIEALRETLIIATRNATGQLAQHNGFYGNPDVRIPLPGVLQSTRDTLERFGAAGPVDHLHERLNRAAEDAAPQARELFLEAIEDLTLEDARAIIQGPDDAATRHFQTRMSDPLAARMRPIIDAALNESGAIRAYNNVLTEVEDLPFVPDVAFEPTEHVVEHAMAGLFDTLAQEEAALRADPVGHGSELLKRVFGNRD